MEGLAEAFKGLYACGCALAAACIIMAVWLLSIYMHLHISLHIWRG